MTCRECGKALSTSDVDKIAMEMVMKREKEGGRSRRDVSMVRVPYIPGVFHGHIKPGKRGLRYDVESTGPDGPRFIEVKGHGHYEREAALQESESLAYHDPRIQPLYWIYYVDFCHTESPEVDHVRVKQAVFRGSLTLNRRFYRSR